SCPAPSPQPSPARGEGARSPFDQGRYCYFNGIELNALPTLPAVSRTAGSGDPRRTKFTRHSPLATRHFRFSAAPTADPGGSPRSCSTFREGGLEGPREWNPNRPVSEMAPDRDLIRESIEKQPVRTVAEACERTLSTQRSGTGIGDAVRNHVVVPAVVCAQSEPDRTTLEVHQPSRSLRPLPADLRSVSSCHPRGSRRSFNHSRRKAEVADDAQVPAIRRCFTHGRVRYKWLGVSSFFVEK